MGVLCRVHRSGAFTGGARGTHCGEGTGNLIGDKELNNMEESIDSSQINIQH